MKHLYNFYAVLVISASVFEDTAKGRHTSEMVIYIWRLISSMHFESKWDPSTRLEFIWAFLKLTGLLHVTLQIPSSPVLRVLTYTEIPAEVVLTRGQICCSLTEFYFWRFLHGWLGCQGQRLEKGRWGCYFQILFFPFLYLGQMGR